MKIVRLMKKYPLSGGYMILILFVVSLIMFDILGSYNRELQWKKDADNYRYPYEYKMTAFSFPKDKISEFIKQAGDVDGVNVKIEEMWVSATKEAGRYGYVDAVISSATEERYPMKEGTLPRANANPSQAAIGVEYMEDIYSRDGEAFFEIDGKEYCVSGIIESPYSDYMNEKIVIYFSDLKSVRQKEIGENLSFTVQSDSAPDDALNQLYRIIKELSPGTNIQAYRETEDTSEPLGIDSEARRLQWILIGFCALVLALVADFWIEDRKREIAVKKTFGYGTWRILAMLMGELLEFMAVSFAIYLAFWGIRIALGIQEELFLLQNDMRNLWIILMLLMILLVVGVFIPAVRTLRYQPADILKKE